MIFVSSLQASKKDILILCAGENGDTVANHERQPIVTQSVWEAGSLNMFPGRCMSIGKKWRHKKNTA